MVPAIVPLVSGIPTLPPSALGCWDQNLQREENPTHCQDLYRVPGKEVSLNWMPSLDAPPCHRVLTGSVCPRLGVWLRGSSPCLAGTRSGGNKAATRLFFLTNPINILGKIIH